MTSHEPKLHAIDQNGECIQGCGMGVCPTSCGDEADRLRQANSDMRAYLEARHSLADFGVWMSHNRQWVNQA